MTREEAINWLKVINTKEFAWDEFALQESQRKIRERCEQGVREAIDMAIEALQTDAVSREDWSNLVEEYKNTIGAIMAVISAPTGIKEISDHFAELIKEEQTDSVVRCKDCRYYWGNLSEDDTDEMYGECRWDSDEMPNADDFCSYGERAEQTEYKLPGHDEVMEALDNMRLEFTINGKERIKRIGGDND